MQFFIFGQQGVPKMKGHPLQNISRLFRSRSSTEMIHFGLENLIYFFLGTLNHYRVTHQVVTNLPLASKQKFRFGLACPDLALPKLNFCFEGNG